MKNRDNSDLKVEFNSRAVGYSDPHPYIMVTPAIDENYWLLRVRVSPKQAVVAFPKFCTIGVGFQVEEDDWNTNLPYSKGPEEIWQHIKNNVKVKGDQTPTPERCLAALTLLINEVTRLEKDRKQREQTSASVGRLFRAGPDDVSDKD